MSESIVFGLTFIGTILMLESQSFLVNMFGLVFLAGALSISLTSWIADD